MPTQVYWLRKAAHLLGSGVQPAPLQPLSEQSAPQKRSPRCGEPTVRLETQRLLASFLAQSSSLWQAAHRLPSALRTQARFLVSQVDPRPHSRCTVAGSLASQYPAQVPLLGTHWLGPAPVPLRSTQLKLLGQSAFALQCRPQKVSCDCRLRTHRSPGPPHSTSPAPGAQSGRPPRRLPPDRRHSPPPPPS